MADAVDSEGQVPVTVNVTERKHRSIGVGVRYRTDEGPGGNVSWEHRNLFGQGEQVAVEADGVVHRRAADRHLPQAGIRRRNQALLGEAQALLRRYRRLQEPVLYHQVGLERQLAKA